MESIKKIFDDKSTEALTEFAFKLYDTNKDDHISELDMFSLLAEVTEIKYHDKPLKLEKIKTRPVKPDMEGQSRTQSPTDDEKSKSIRIQKN